MGSRPPRISGPALALCALALFSSPLVAAPLNDTGQQQCWDGMAMTTCTEATTGDSATFPGQDGRYGRDAAATAGVLTKTGAGAAGFDFTKLDVNGSPLADQTQAWSHDVGGFDNGTEAAGTAWTCVEDNVTGLVWSVKTNKAVSDLRDKDWTYTWYDSDPTRNAGNAGTPDPGAGGGSNNCLDTARCDTEKYIADVNAQNICGETTDDWRLPTRDELKSIVHYGAAAAPYIDGALFPNTLNSVYWSSSSYAPNPSNAWSVLFGNGLDGTHHKGNGGYVRLVRGG